MKLNIISFTTRPKAAGKQDNKNFPTYLAYFPSTSLDVHTHKLVCFTAVRYLPAVTVLGLIFHLLVWART